MTPHSQADLSAIQRYKIGYHSDDWGQRSSTPSGIPDASGSWVRYADHVAALAAPSTPTSGGWISVERHSDQSVLVVFPSCRLASEFERSLLPASPTIGGESK